MRLALLVTCCWPGLYRLWLRGDPAGFLPAVGCAAAVNVALWFSLGSTAGLSLGWQGLIWLVVTVGWGLAAWREIQALGGLSQETYPEVEGLFVSAQAEYLKGHWFEAEGLALQIIKRRPGDLEGQLLLASLYRHMKRFDEARRQLKSLARLEGVAKWSYEIQEEARRLDRLLEERENESEEVQEEQQAKAA